MRPALALAALLATLDARAECTPAAPDVIAQAERAAVDAEGKADRAESIAVRSGNTGAARRAEEARRAAIQARRHAAELACQKPPALPPASRKPGY